MAVFCVSLISGCTKKSEFIEEDPFEGILVEEELPVLDETIHADIPHIYIDIANDGEVVEKSTYLEAEIYIEGTEKLPNLSKQTTRIRGRGNSTWLLPKKPYRLKLDKKSSVLGLPAAKDWVLLANYNDYTLMTNAIAMKIGKQLGMPYTNDIIPVDLTINGTYRGSYNLTQQIEVKENRVDVGDDGILWELDSYFDEDMKFKSTYYNLPVMLKDPDMESAEQFSNWRSDFQNFEDKIASKDFPNTSYGDVFDKQQLVNFIIVNMFVGNDELSHPKSVYMHKKAGGKYTMGPIWDFDYGFGFTEEGQRTYFNYANLSVMQENDKRVGAVFFRRFFEDPEIRSLFISTWNNYKENNFDDLMEFIEVYASTIRASQKKDYEIWKVGNNNHAQNKADMKTYLRKRIHIVDRFIQNF